MIPSPFGWRAERVRDGLVLVHPDGPATGTIAYADRLRPLARSGALVDAALARMPAFAIDSIGPLERLVTYEGEHGAAITVLGRQHGRAVQCDLGFVFGDDFYAQVSGLCREAGARPQFRTLVRELAQQDSQALGLRRRRFEYAPPPEWQPIPHSLATEWLAPDYPANRTWMMVYPANPATLVPEATLTTSIQYLRHLGNEIEDREQEVVRVGPLVGRSQIILAKQPDHPAMLREIVELEDTTFVYLLELSSFAIPRWVELRKSFKTLIESIKPVPRAGHPEQKTRALSFLAE